MKLIIKRVVLFAVLLFFKPHFGFSQMLHLDSTFNETGKLVLPQITPSADEICNNMAINPDGSIILAGTSKLNGRTKGLIIKIKENGGIDSTFGNNGAVSLQATNRDTRINDVLVQSDGKITVVGECTTGSDYDGKFLLARFTSTGIPDTSFGTNGRVIIEIGGYQGNGQSLTIQNDGKYLVAGSTNYFGSRIVPILIRFTNTGVLDNSFNGVGYNYVNDLTFGNSGALKVLLGSDQKISISGYANVGSGQQYFLYRFLQNGTLDNSFNSDGKRVYSNVTGFEYGMDLTETTNQKILALGWSLSTVYKTDLTLFNPDGSLHSVNFTNGPLALPDTPNFQAKKIVNYENGYLISCDLGNPTYKFKPGLMIVNQSGALVKPVADSGIFASFFDYSDKATNSAIKIPADNKIVLCGSILNGATNSFWVVRILPFSMPTEDTAGTQIRSVKKNQIDLSFFPNPVKNKTVSFQYKGSAGSRSIVILDVSGKTVHKESKTIKEEMITESIVLPNSIPAGIYFLRLQTIDGVVTKQFNIN